MPQPPNVRSKSPRQLAGDLAASEPGLGHAGRWGLTASRLLPEEPEPQDLDVSPTPPPVAVHLSAPPARRTLPPPPLEPESWLETTAAKPSRWRVWAAASALAVAGIGAVALLREAPKVDGAEAALVGQLETGSPRGSAVLKPSVKGPASATGTTPASADEDRRAASTATGYEHINNERHIPVSGGVMHLPSTFHPRAGGYDLIVHFHGDVKIVKESVEHAGVNAAVAIINLGISSGPYQNTYQDPTHFERLLTQVQNGITERGYKNVELRRLALNAWSGGYGAIQSILDSRRAPDSENDPLDAVMLFDGVHTHFIDDGKTQLAELGLLTFSRAARAAADGRILFTVTHSQIDPIDYAGTDVCANALLKSVGANPEVAARAPQHVKLKAAAMSIGRETKLEPTTDTRVGDFHVMGFRGVTREAHAAHLLQMGEVGLPELAARWAEPAPPRRRPIDADASVEQKLPSVRSVLDARKLAR
jgi:hypothetical protein